ncbi:MAG: TIGR04552 family protein [bacterium]
MASSQWHHDWLPINQTISGESIIDFSHLNVRTKNEAKTFLKAYGYDVDDPITYEEIWRVYFEALNFIRNVLLEANEKLPPSFYERTSQNDILKLLVEASVPQGERSGWACAILRVMHTISHLDNDLKLENFHTAREKIFAQFDPFVRQIAPRKWSFGKPGEEGVPLVRYQKKVKKERNSMIVKLISKAQNDVELIYDSLGFRFVVEKKIDAIRLVEKFFELGAISYANIQPRKSFNNLLDIKVIHENMESLRKDVEAGRLSPSEADKKYSLLDIPLMSVGEAGVKNSFSSPHYRSLQFTCQHLVHVQNSILPVFEKIREQLEKTISGRRFLKSFPIVLRERKAFYYPYEIQITDKESYVENLRGRSSHRDYKEKRRVMARKRVLSGIYGIIKT